MVTYQDVPHNFNIARYFLDRHVEEGRGGRVALHCGGRAYTYGELARVTNRIGHVLRSLGVEQEQRVLLALRDGVEFVATWYAVVKIGAVVSEVYTFLQPGDYAYFLNYTRAGVVVVDAATLESMRAAAPACPFLRRVLVVGPIEVLRPNEVSFDTRLAGAPDDLEAADTSKDDVALWKFTTGTTGRPKAAVHAHYAPYLSFHNYALGVVGYRPDDVVLPVPKLFFGYARDCATLFPFGVGAAAVIFAERSTPERLFELIAQYRPTIMVHVPTAVAAMARHPDAHRHDLSCLRLCTSAGEALPAEVYDLWKRRFGVEILDGIGSSELYHIYISNRHGVVRPGSLGQPVPGYRAEVLDPEGRPVPDGEVGELWVEGETAALMYWNDRARTVGTFQGNRVRTGDLVRRDANGDFWYQGRADDLVKVSGIWVAPLEVEHCLLQHPAVREAAVAGETVEGFTRLVAYVAPAEPHPGAAAFAAELQAFARGRLAPHKTPREIHVLDALPRTPAGKIDRKALKAGRPAAP